MLYVIRHGERLDEVDFELWEGRVKEAYKSPATGLGRPLRAPRCMLSDAPLTANGVNMAAEAAASLKVKLDSESSGAGIRCVYVSRYSIKLPMIFHCASNISVF